jgi:nitrogen fixation NifU-like protein
MIGTQDVQLKEIYKDIILDHYAHPRHGAALAHPSASAQGHNPVCGDKLEVMLKIDEQEVIRELAVVMTGCSICVASGSMMADELEGKTLGEGLQKLSEFRAMMKGEGPMKSELGELESLEGVSKLPIRIKCALLPWVTLEQAIAQYKGRRPETVRTEESFS